MGPRSIKSATFPITGLTAKGTTVVEWLHQFDPDAARQDIHGLLGQTLFSGEDGFKPTDEALSGGETAAAPSAASATRSSPTCWCR